MLKLGYNEATCKENSTVENDLLLLSLIHI